MISLKPLQDFKIKIEKEVDGKPKLVSMNLYDATDADFEQWFVREYFSALLDGEGWNNDNRLAARLWTLIEVGYAEHIFGNADLNKPTFYAIKRMMNKKYNIKR